MADLSPTAASVSITSGTSVKTGIAGEAITEGQAVYRSATDGKIYLAIATGKSEAQCVGMCVGGAAAADLPVSYGTGLIDISSGATQGLIYVLSGATAGDMSPHSDATTPASGEYTTVVAIAKSASRLLVEPVVSDTTV